MKKKYFYSHLVETSSLSLSLGDISMTPQERKHLILLIEANLHQAIVDLVLSELSEEDKKLFLLHLHTENHTKMWHLLEKRIENIEGKIRDVSEAIKKQLHSDITEVKHS